MRYDLDLASACADAAEELVASLRRIQPRGPYLMGVTAAAGPVALDLVETLGAAGERIDLLGLFDWREEGARAGAGADAAEEAVRGALRALTESAGGVVLRGSPATLARRLRAEVARL